MKLPRLLLSRRICLVFALLGACTEVQSASLTVTLPNVKGAADTELKVPISVKAAQGLGPLQMDLLFDSRQLQFVKAAPGAGFGVGLFDSNLLEPGRLRLVMTGDPNKPIQGDGELFAVVFKATGAAGAEGALNADKVRAWEQTPEALEMRVTTEAGSVTITSHAMPLWLITAGGAGLVLLLFALTRMHHTRRGPQSAPAGAVTEQPAARKRFCGACGAQLSPATKFCPSCGQAIGG